MFIKVLVRSGKYGSGAFARPFLFSTFIFIHCECERVYVDCGTDDEPGRSAGWQWRQWRKGTWKVSAWHSSVWNISAVMMKRYGQMVYKGPYDRPTAVRLFGWGTWIQQTPPPNPQLTSLCFSSPKSNTILVRSAPHWRPLSTTFSANFSVMGVAR